MATAVWSTYVRVDDVDAATARATRAGGALLLGPFDAEPDGRLAVLADPAGVAVSLWEAGARPGAESWASRAAGR